MKTYLITWVSEGLWYCLAKQIISMWDRVIWLSRNKPDLDIIHIKCDLAKEEEILMATDKIKDLGEINFIINWAGVFSVDKIEEIDYKNMERVFKINSLAPIFLVSKMFEIIEKYKTDIVNISSTVANKWYIDQDIYTATKAWISGFTKTLQHRFKGKENRVIWFNPGWFKSNIFEKATWIKPDLTNFMNPEDIAKFLLQILDLPKNMEISDITINRK